MAPPLTGIKIVKYCDVWGGGHWGGAKILQKIMASPLSVIKIGKYCGVRGRGGGGGALRGTKILEKIMAFPFSVIKIVKYCGIRRGGGVALRGAKILQKIMAPHLSVLKIVGKNILLINNIIVYCLSLLPSVLFEKLTATAVFYFTRCQLETFDRQLSRNNNSYSIHYLWD